MVGNVKFRQKQKTRNDFYFNFCTFHIFQPMLMCLFFGFRADFNGQDWPYDSPVAGSYDVKNTSTKLIILNNRYGKVSLHVQRLHFNVKMCQCKIKLFISLIFIILLLFYYFALSLELPNLEMHQYFCNRLLVKTCSVSSRMAQDCEVTILVRRNLTGKLQ